MTTKKHFQNRLQGYSFLVHRQFMHQAQERHRDKQKKQCYRDLTWAKQGNVYHLNKYCHVFRSWLAIVL